MPVAGENPGLVAPAAAHAVSNRDAIEDCSDPGGASDRKLELEVSETNTGLPFHQAQGVAPQFGRQG